MLGGLITLAPEPLYNWYADRTEVWNFTLMEDQQSAGLVMWVLASFDYLPAGLAVIGFWLNRLRSNPQSGLHLTLPNGAKY
ncbi:cytochrome c oxidase assembly protein [Microvirga pakistanensis]|uniref:cytochrome c oxidase assembly protein n=1 Tax=Microvirga pakistanensis TaxID=1682650 RepID=UPI00106BCBD1|nr:cytochrome c oxidase assembly protein [Microvirga pakistanensis]